VHVAHAKAYLLHVKASPSLSPLPRSSKSFLPKKPEFRPLFAAPPQHAARLTSSRGYLTDITPAMLHCDDQGWCSSRCLRTERSKGLLSGVDVTQQGRETTTIISRYHTSCRSAIRRAIILHLLNSTKSTAMHYHGLILSQLNSAHTITPSSTLFAYSLRT
jgi:hypothetical protein